METFFKKKITSLKVRTKRPMGRIAHQGNNWYDKSAEWIHSTNKHFV